MGSGAQGLNTICFGILGCHPFRSFFSLTPPIQTSTAGQYKADGPIQGSDSGPRQGTGFALFPQVQHAGLRRPLPLRPPQPPATRYILIRLGLGQLAGPGQPPLATLVLALSISGPPQQAVISPSRPVHCVAWLPNTALPQPSHGPGHLTDTTHGPWASLGVPYLRHAEGDGSGPIRGRDADD